MRISDWSSDVCSSDLELLPDRARSDDQQLLGHFRRHHRVTIGPNALAVRLGERQVARPRAGGDDDVLCLKLGGLAVPGDREPALGDDLPLALADGEDRKSVVSGKSVSVRVDLGGCRKSKKKKKSINLLSESSDQLHN